MYALSWFVWTQHLPYLAPIPSTPSQYQVPPQYPVSVRFVSIEGSGVRVWLGYGAGHGLALPMPTSGRSRRPCHGPALGSHERPPPVPSLRWGRVPGYRNRGAGGWEDGGRDSGAGFWFWKAYIRSRVAYSEMPVGNLFRNIPEFLPDIPDPPPPPPPYSGAHIKAPGLENGVPWGCQHWVNLL